MSPRSTKDQNFIPGQITFDFIDKVKDPTATIENTIAHKDSVTEPPQYPKKSFDPDLAERDFWTRQARKVKSRAKRSYMEAEYFSNSTVYDGV